MGKSIVESQEPVSRAPLRAGSLIGAGLAMRVLRRSRRLSDDAWWNRNTRAIQNAQLRSLLRRAAKTSFGQQHHFQHIATKPDGELATAFRNAVQPQEYEPYRARLAAMRESAEPDVLWPGVVRDWAETSGTTGGQKYIPVSRAMMRSNFLAALDIFAHAMRFGVSLPRMFGGKLLFLGGSTSVTTNSHGIRTGDLSGLVTPLIRWPLSEVYSPGRDIALMNDWPAKIEAMADQCAAQDIRMVSGMASWALVLFEQIIERARRGGSAKAAARLQDAWPNLQLFVHGGVKYQPFDPRVRCAWSGQLAGQDIPHRLEVYPASEGFIAMQDRKGDPGLRLNTDIGNFYEFMPVEEIESASARTFCCDEVEPGQRYVVVMTTCAGLWRYIIGDTVEFDTVPRNGRKGGGPARLRIVGRHKHFVNAFGENLIVEDIERAVVHAMNATGAQIGEFSAAPVYPGAGRRSGVELVVEWNLGPAESLRSQFAQAFDAALRRINVDYATKRTGDLGMALPLVTVVPMGSFHRWMADSGKLGGQHKAPRCANHREVIEAVIEAGLRQASQVKPTRGGDTIAVQIQHGIKEGAM